MASGAISWATELTAEDADLIVSGSVPNQSLGERLAVVDVDGDGCDDIVTPSYYHPLPYGGAETFVLFGQYGP